MPIADDPDARPEPDPFDGLVLDEDFVRAATVKEQSGRARMLAAKWKREPPEPVPPHGHPAPQPPGPSRRLGDRLGRHWKTVLIVLAVCAMAVLGLQLGGTAKPAPTPAPSTVVTTPSAPADGPATPTATAVPKLI
ncbi:hypothetical protein ABT095_28180 [Kitasatospora sp. NPDC002227]|uniref:SCO2583/SCO2584 N-terminal domain-containing protein n=1 Tax=Kitasatospora sp. NPDC002227 TaxID=3154773 RepID=UPI00332B791A